MNILFVCTGNTCRSPMAEGYLKSKNLPQISVKSRGLSADGSEVSRNSAEVMAEKGIDISCHVSSPITKDDLLWADKIICLSFTHKSFLEGFVVDSSKLLILGHGITDPFGGDIKVYRKCRDEIFKEIDFLIASGEFSNFSVTEAAEDIAEKIADLEKVCFSSPWSKSVIVDAMKHGTVFFAATRNDKLIGYIGISVILDEGYITNVAVYPEYRKKGVATALLNAVFSLAEEKKLSFVSLEVRESNNAAISLYKKLGFNEAGLRKNFYDNPKENAIILTKDFKNEDFKY